MWHSTEFLLKHFWLVNHPARSLFNSYLFQGPVLKNFFSILQGILVTVSRRLIPEFVSCLILNWFVFSLIKISNNLSIKSELIILWSNSKCNDGFGDDMFDWFSGSIVFVVDLLFYSILHWYLQQFFYSVQNLLLYQEENLVYLTFLPI